MAFENLKIERRNDKIGEISALVQIVSLRLIYILPNFEGQFSNLIAFKAERLVDR